MEAGACWELRDGKAKLAMTGKCPPAPPSVPCTPLGCRLALPSARKSRCFLGCLLPPPPPRPHEATSLCLGRDPSLLSCQNNSRPPSPAPAQPEKCPVQAGGPRTEGHSHGPGQTPALCAPARRRLCYLELPTAFPPSPQLPNPVDMQSLRPRARKPLSLPGTGRGIGAPGWPPLHWDPRGGGFRRRGGTRTSRALRALFQVCASDPHRPAVSEWALPGVHPGMWLAAPRGLGPLVRWRGGKLPQGPCLVLGGVGCALGPEGPENRETKAGLSQRLGLWEIPQGLPCKLLCCSPAPRTELRCGRIRGWGLSRGDGGKVRPQGGTLIQSTSQ